MKEKLMVLGAAAIALGFALWVKPAEPACIRLEAKLSLARDFCEGLGERAAKERCDALSEDPEVMGQCMRVVVPAAVGSCMHYVNLEHMKADYESACK